MGRRVAIVGLVGLVAGVLGMSRRVDWSTLCLRAFHRAMTWNWIPIQLKEGGTLHLDLHDDEMLNNVQPEPFADGRLGSVAQWHRQQETMPKEAPEWPAWLAPYPRAEHADTFAGPWLVVSSTERRGLISRTYRAPEQRTNVIEHYRGVLEHGGIGVTGQTQDPSGVSGVRGESGDHNRTVDLQTLPRPVFDLVSGNRVWPIHAASYDSGS